MAVCWAAEGLQELCKVSKPWCTTQGGALGVWTWAFLGLCSYVEKFSADYRPTLHIRMPLIQEPVDSTLGQWQESLCHHGLGEEGPRQI